VEEHNRARIGTSFLVAKDSGSTGSSFAGSNHIDVRSRFAGSNHTANIDSACPTLGGSIAAGIHTENIYHLDKGTVRDAFYHELFFVS
jgi:hypothetical protein